MTKIRIPDLVKDSYSGNFDKDSEFAYEYNYPGGFELRKITARELYSILLGLFGESHGVWTTECGTTHTYTGSDPADVLEAINNYSNVTVVDIIEGEKVDLEVKKIYKLKNL